MKFHLASAGILIASHTLALNLAFAQTPSESVGSQGGKAKADLISKNGSTVKGTVQFETSGSALKISYDITGLKKNGTFGFHVHEMGDCSSADGKSAGKHFAKMAPAGGTSLDFPDKYAGDLPSLKADAKGEAKGSIEVSTLTLDGEHGVQGRAIIIHGGPDDIKKKSAPRIACGVIEPVKATL